MSPGAKHADQPRLAPPLPVPDLRLARANLEIETRHAILAAAAKILSNEGPSALTVRRVAEAVNASTKVIYTHFCNKAGLLDALYLHSFEGLGAAFQHCLSIPAPLARLRALSAAYRRYALAEPAFYNMMFGDLGRAYEAPLESRRMAWRTFGILRNAVAICLPTCSRQDIDQTGRLLWAAMHGVVSLELRGLLGNTKNGAEMLQNAVNAILKARGLE